MSMWYQWFIAAPMITIDLPSVFSALVANPRATAMICSRGTELIVTAFRDPTFGVIVGCGSGGGLTELVGDLVVERAPVGVELASHMLRRVRAARHAADLHGALPLEPAATFIARFSQLASSAPWERFVFEVNPVAWRRGDAIALDGLLLIGEAAT